MRKDIVKLPKADESLVGVAKKSSSSSMYHISQIPKLVLVDDEEYFFEVEDF